MARPTRTPLAWRLAFLYGALFLIVGCYLPYMPVWLHWRGVDEDAIGFLLAVPLFARVLFTPIISFVSDRTQARRGVLVALSWLSLGSFVLLWLAGGTAHLFVAMLLLALSWTSIMPLIEAVAVSAIRTARLHYGRVRLWGSGTFILASFGSGIAIGAFGSWIVLPILVAGTTLMIVGVHLLPRNVGGQPAISPARRIRLADAIDLARSPQFLLFLLAASAIQASHAVYYTFGTLNWREQGFSDATIGALWAIGVIAEIALFAISDRVLAALGATRLLLAAAAGAVVRWALMAGDPSLLATAVLQGLHAFTFGAAHLAAIYFLTHAVPEDRGATAQGVYAAVVAGLGVGLATLASGPLYKLMGGQAYAVMAMIALVGAVSARLLESRWHGGLVVPPLDAQPQSEDGGGIRSPAS